jgi:hypothetical protein
MASAGFIKGIVRESYETVFSCPAFGLCETAHVFQPKKNMLSIDGCDEDEETPDLHRNRGVWRAMRALRVKAPGKSLSIRSSLMSRASPLSVCQITGLIWNLTR